MARLEMRGLRNDVAGPFDLILQPAEIVTITGPSGAGKSVFLRMIADLDPNEGEVLLDGRQRSSFSGPAWRHRVTYGAAEPGWWHEQVGEHFATFPLDMAERIGLSPNVFGRAVRLCSTGERQRLALLRSLALNPAVLLLDEPTASLDPASVGMVEEILRDRAAHGMALLMVTHDAGQAERLGQRHLRLMQGRLSLP